MSEDHDSGAYHPHEADKASDEVKDDLLSGPITEDYRKGVNDAVEHMRERWKGVDPADMEGGQ